MLNQDYNGRLDFHFIAESEDDPAVTHLKRYLNARCINLVKGAEIAPGRSLKLELAGLTFHNS